MTISGRERSSKTMERCRLECNKSLLARIFKGKDRQPVEGANTLQHSAERHAPPMVDTSSEENESYCSIQDEGTAQVNEFTDSSSTILDTTFYEGESNRSFSSHSSIISLSHEPLNSSQTVAKGVATLPRKVGVNIENGIKSLSAIISGSPGRFSETFNGIRCSSAIELSRFSLSSASETLSKEHYGSFSVLDTSTSTPTPEVSQSSLSEKSETPVRVELSPVSSPTSSFPVPSSSTRKRGISFRSPSTETLGEEERDSRSSKSIEGLEQLDYLTVHRGDCKTQIELHRGRIDRLLPKDRTDYLLVCDQTREPVDMDSRYHMFDCLSILNGYNIDIQKIQELSKKQKLLRESYHCWISCKLRARDLYVPGLEYGRFLVHEPPTNNCLDSIFCTIVDAFCCLTALVGCSMTPKSLLIPLTGENMKQSRAYRNDALKVILEVATIYVSCGLPLRIIKILLPEKTSVDQEVRFFARFREDWLASHEQPLVIQRMEQKDFQYDCLLLHGPTEENEVFEIKSRLEAMDKQARSVYELLPRNLEAKGTILLSILWERCPLSPLVVRTLHTCGPVYSDSPLNVAIKAVCQFFCSQERVRDMKDEKFGIVRAYNGDKSRKHFKDVFGSSYMNANNKEDLSFTVTFEESDDLSSNRQVNDLFEDDEDSQLIDSNICTLSNIPNWKSRWNIDPNLLEIGTRIGAGGSGEVFKATYQRQVVAVKLLIHDNDSQSKDSILDFKGEMVLMSSLNHPNIVKFVGAVTSPPKLCIVTEFVAGGCLYRYLARKRAKGERLPAEEYIRIALDVAKGMEYLHTHSHQIIHLDLKSPNILLHPQRNTFQAKIADFGLSCVSEKKNTGFGGTAEWMAPEVMRQENYDEKVDVYSFGVILWELVTCEKPWGNDHPSHIIQKVSVEGQRLHVPREKQQGVPAEILNLVDLCQDSCPSKRPSFSECVKILKRLCI